MDEKSRDHFRTLLEARAKEIRALLASSDSADDSIEVDDAIGRLTRMEAIQAQAMSNEGRRRQQDRLPRIEAALSRISDGTYGICVRCANEIPRGRLEIMPEAAVCVQCAAT